MTKSQLKLCYLGLLGFMFVDRTSATPELPVFKALSMIETGCRDHVVGRAGERGRYQITADVWKAYSSTMSFKHYAKDSSISTRVAGEYLHHLLIQYEKATGKHATYHEVYVMWNMGFDGYRRHGFDLTKVSRKIRDRAERYMNLVILYSGKN
jgi:hypothetical protein